MKIRVLIKNIDGRYRVQVDTLGFTALEEEKLVEFGEPQVDIGSDFSGSASRPGQNPTVVTITPVSGGSSATAVASVSDVGVITGISVTNPGSGYNSGANAVVSGDGQGATISSVTVVGGAVTAVVIDNGGTGYHQVPLSVNFTLQPALRRIRTDFPIVQIFDLGDTPEADVQAQVYASTIVSRLTAAKTNLIAQNSDFEGESLVTV